MDLFIRLYGLELFCFIREAFPLALQSLYDPLDLYQMTVFEAFRRSGTFQHISRASTAKWLRVLAKRQIGMALRAERRLKRGGGAALADPGNIAPAGLVKSYGLYLRTPSQSAVRNETMLRIEVVLSSLPAHLQQAVRLRHIEELSPREVARRMNKSERSAATLCARGLRLMRRKLRNLVDPL